jgi:hypothetical protein
VTHITPVGLAFYVRTCRLELTAKEQDMIQQVTVRKVEQIALLCDVCERVVDYTSIEELSHMGIEESFEYVCQQCD